MPNLSANSGDPDQMPHTAASDLGLDCLPILQAKLDKFCDYADWSGLY